MLIRSPVIILDEALCGLQGLGSAMLYNAIKGATLINPVHAAIGVVNFVLAEKIVRSITDHIVPGPYAFLGPIPIGLKNIVSYSLALNITLRIMKVAGLVFSIPPVVSYLGLGAAAVVVLSIGASLCGLKPTKHSHQIKVAPT